ncbi:ABC transporter ATP-binding protein [Rhodobacter sp. 24-YEA-8]|uniref:ABC transporter ATP-binding protein n=1 Tax=Rhodobacter sp. 24-YEA-8 TaxID=1884310 RepID=UPI00089CDB48|nr:ABC transporter ATP-binding protein [Rhodobacter sp. 24-YEA-8]SED11594.1 energy-coupling factor transport system ATP-binding protein [Rhodobacter sp. 24-YEA-8]
MTREDTVIADDLSFGYPGQARLFERLSLRFAPGAVVAVLGPNGRGKSSLLRLFAGLEKPLAGRISVAGVDPAGPEARDLARVAGMVAQSSDRHFLRTKVQDEVALTARNLDLPAPAALAAQALERLGIADLAAQHPLDLDAGEKRLVALASAIAHGPRLLLLDEIQRGLDRINRQKVIRLIGAEAAQGTTILAVTHDRDFAEAIAGAELVFGDEGIRLT